MTERLADISAYTIDAAAALQDVTAFAEEIMHTVRVARALLIAGRIVCLDGLEAQVAQLCARCLGLDCGDAGTVRLHLILLRAELDALAPLLSAGRETA